MSSEIGTTTRKDDMLQRFTVGAVLATALIAVLPG
jgi:hypothetical protein